MEKLFLQITKTIAFGLVVVNFFSCQKSDPEPALADQVMGELWSLPTAFEKVRLI